MNGFRNSSRNGQVWRWQRAGSRPLFWRSVDAGWKRQKHGDGLPVLHPGQTGSSLPEKGLNNATGAAGEGCNEKAAFITPGIQKAE